MRNSSGNDQGKVETRTLPHSNRRLFVGPTEEQPVAPAICVFCGDPLTGRRSKEHVFARWLMAHYDSHAKPFRIAWTSDANDELLADREFAMGNLVAGRVCRDCNNGWMSDLEQDASASLLELASKKRPLATLDASERKTLARWAAKTSFAARSADMGPRLVSAAQAMSLVGGAMPAVHVAARQAPLNLGLGWFATQRWLVSYPDDALAEAARLVSTSHKTVLTIGRLLLSVCFWPDPQWPLVISRCSHSPLWPTHGTWLTYPQATDGHGAGPTAETEIVDMVIGTRIAHPASQGEFVPVAALSF